MNAKELYNKLFNAINALNLKLNFDVEQELKFTMLKLQELKMPKDQNTTALEGCSSSSIIASITKMFMLGLQISKDQCYLTVDFRTRDLIMKLSYFGNVILAKKGEVSDVIAHCYYEGEEIEFDVNPETGRTRIVKHKKDLDAIDKCNIKGVYVVIIKKSGAIDIEIISKKEIDMAWSKSKGGQTVHNDYPRKMATKSALNIALSYYVSTGISNNTDDETTLQEKHEEIQTNMLLQEDVKIELEEIKIEDTRTVDEDGAIHDSIIYEENNTNKEDSKEDEEVDF